MKRDLFVPIVSTCCPSGNGGRGLGVGVGLNDGDVEKPRRRTRCGSSWMVWKRDL